MALSPPRCEDALGLFSADPTRRGLADLPYELQVAILDATNAQIFFVGVSANTMTVARSPWAGLALACRLSRCRYTRNKTLHLVSGPDRCIWVDSEADIFLLHSDDTARCRTFVVTDFPVDGVDRSMMRRVAVNLEYLGQHPRASALTRLLSIFPSITALHVLVPQGPPRTPTPRWDAVTMVLSALPRSQVIAPPGQDVEMWAAVKYQLRKTLTRISQAESGANALNISLIVGHTARVGHTILVGQRPREYTESKITNHKINCCC